MTPVLAFGDDGSPGADLTWNWITDHRWDGWRLEVVTAEPHADMHPVEPEEAHLHVWDPEDPRETESMGFDSVEHLRAEVDPRVALISKSWDLVAIGPRGSGMPESLHLGSTADWLLRAPVTPLVIVRQRGPVRRILVGADGSPHVGRAIETLTTLPWLDGVAVHVMTVSERRIDTEEALHQATDALSSSGADLDTVVREGRPTSVILEEIDRTDPDLIVMGARGLTGIRRMVIGSTTAALAGTVDRSILVAHALDEAGS